MKSTANRKYSIIALWIVPAIITTWLAYLWIAFPAYRFAREPLTTYRALAKTCSSVQEWASPLQDQKMKIDISRMHLPAAVAQYSPQRAFASRDEVSILFGRGRRSAFTVIWKHRILCSNDWELVMCDGDYDKTLACGHRDRIKECVR